MKIFGNATRKQCPICQSKKVGSLWTIPFSSVKETEVNGAFTNMLPILDVESTVYKYSLCNNCQSVFLSPYDQAARESYKTSTFHSSKFEDKERWQGYVNQYNNHIKPALLPLVNDEGLRLLDAGCGAGQYLFCAAEDKSINYKLLVGVELSLPAVELINKEAEIRCQKQIMGHQADLDETDSLLSLDMPPFDIVVLSETFEHLEYPLIAMKSLVRSLRAGGRIFYTAQCPGGNLPVRPAEPIYMSEKGQHILLDSVGLRMLTTKVEAGRWKTVAEKK